MRLLEKNPDKRFASATELRVVLEAELQRLENPSARATASQEIVRGETRTPAMAFDDTAAYQSGEIGVVRPDESGVASQPDVITASGVPPTSSSSRLVMIALVMVVLCVLLAGGLFAVVSQDRAVEEDVEESEQEVGLGLHVAAIDDRTEARHEARRIVAQVEQKP